VTFAYFDTSALIKRYVSERGSSRVVSLLRRHHLLSSAITPVEIVSALSRRKRERELSADDFTTSIRRIQSERAGWELIEIGAAVLDRAEEVVQGSLPIRSLDAIHVASLLFFQSATGGRIPFITGDLRQKASAAALGIDVIWIG
jgi:predicted nucleic acid-binding protein